MDPIVEDFFDAIQGHSCEVDFSSTPQWMWNTAKDIPYPEDPDTCIWNYQQGTELRDPSFKVCVVVFFVLFFFLISFYFRKLRNIIADFFLGIQMEDLLMSMEFLIFLDIIMTFPIGKF
jgi:hypothetical protein